MAENFYYNYAELDPETNECVGFQSLEDPAIEVPSNWVRVPVEDPEYLGKYYINGQWYEDAAGTIPWQSSLI